MTASAWPVEGGSAGGGSGGNGFGGGRTEPVKFRAPVDLTLGGIRRWGAAALAAAGIEGAPREAHLLLALALDVPNLHVVARDHERIPGQALCRYRKLIRDRCRRVPLQYLRGSQEFMGLEFFVNPSVLIPRPETEILVESVLGHFTAGLPAPARTPSPLLADVGTGSGAVAVSLACFLPGAVVYAVDISPEALAVARGNAERHGVADRVRPVLGNLLDPLAGQGLRGALAAVVSNPPYIPSAGLAGLAPELAHEPRAALDGGPDGLALVSALIESAPEYLHPGGLLALEIGANQAEPVRSLLEAVGRYGPAALHHDLAGRERVILARVRS